jgi:general stress protein 26
MLPLDRGVHWSTGGVVNLATYTRGQAVSDKNQMSAAQRELWEKIEGVRPAMMTTVGDDGLLRSRPMWTQGDTFDGSLWFFTADDAPKAEELARNPQIGLSYAAPGKDLYVSVSGRAELVHDRAKIEELWNAFAEAWFPDGTDDPHLALLRVDVDHAQYWEDKKPKVLQLAEIAIGILRDVPPKSGEHGRIDL